MDLFQSLQQFFGADAHNVFIVGGAVRDLLSGIPRSDCDLAASLSPARCAALGLQPVRGVTTGEVWAKTVPGAGRIEITLLENSAGLKEELFRRDFTMNAMAMTLSGELIDPLGGKPALEERRLSCCSRDLFKADPVRLFRAFRFECAGFNPDSATAELMSKSNWETALEKIPVERFSREMLKAMAQKRPAAFYRGMVRRGVGRGYLPELFKMSSIPAGPAEFHPEGDLLVHSLEVLERAAHLSADPLTRFCAFWHDIGKLATPPAEYPHHHNHDKAGGPLALEMARRLKLPDRYVRGAEAASRLHQTAGLWPGLRDTTRLKLALSAKRAGLAAVLPSVVAADRGKFNVNQWELAQKTVSMTVEELGVNPRLFEECKDDDWCRNECPLHKRGKRCPMPVHDRASFLMQRRAEMFRKLMERAG